MHRPAHSVKKSAPVLAQALPRGLLMTPNQESDMGIIQGGHWADLDAAVHDTHTWICLCDCTFRWAELWALGWLEFCFISHSCMYL